MADTSVDTLNTTLDADDLPKTPPKKQTKANKKSASKGPGRGNSSLSPQQKDALLNYIEKKNFQRHLLDQEATPFDKEYAAKECVAYMKKQKLDKNIPDSIELKKILRRWRSKISKWRKKKERSGNGYVAPLAEVDERCRNMIDSVPGVAKGKKVFYKFSNNMF